MDDQAFELLSGIQQGINMLPKSMQQSALDNLTKGVTDYPQDCLAKQVLQKALEAATEESRLLKNEQGSPTFWSACEAIKQEVAANPDTQTAMDDTARQRINGYERSTINRRTALRTIAGFGAAAVTGEVIMGGWKTEDGDVNLNKIGRMGAEIAATYLAANHSSKLQSKLMVAKMIEQIAPAVEKEVGQPAVPAGLGAQKSGASR
jgi:hypothetical protein